MKLKMSTALQLTIVVTLVATFAMFSVTTTKTLANVESLCYLSFLSAVLLVLIAQNRTCTYPLVFLLCMYVYQKYLLSGLYLLVAGYSPISADLSIFAPDDYNRYLLYAIPGVLVTGAGLIAGGGWRTRAAGVRGGTLASDQLVSRIVPSRLLIYIALIITIDIYMRFVVGVANDALGEDPRNFLRILLRTTLPRELLVLMIFFAWRKYSHVKKITVVAALSVLLFGTMFVESSRAALQLFITLYLILKVATEGDFSIGRRHLKYAGLICLVSFILFPTVTAIRYAGYDREFFASKDIAAVADQASVFQTNTDVGVLILERLTSLKPGLMILNDRYVTDPTDLLTFEAMIKRIVNNVVPGEIFNVMPPQYLYDHIYNGFFRGFSAEEWGLWEYFYIPYGYWFGLLVVFLYAVVIGRLWRKLSFSRSPYQPFILLISGYFFFLFLLNFDPGYVISSYFIELIVFFIFFPLLTALSIKEFADHFRIIPSLQVRRPGQLVRR